MFPSLLRVFESDIVGVRFGLQGKLGGTGSCVPEAHLVGQTD